MADHHIEVSRLLKIHHAIASGEWSFMAYLVELYGIWVHSIKRDIVMLVEELHAPIPKELGHGI